MRPNSENLQFASGRYSSNNLRVEGATSPALLSTYVIIV